MKNRILSLSILAASLLVSSKASAFVGGPFDNGDYSILLERGGVYQATFSFSNGAGMAMFSQDNSFEVAAGTAVTGMFALHNRSVFYYKGITYAGTATGIVDVDARRITGFTNGSSDFAASGSGAPGVQPQDGNGAARDADIVQNGDVGATANSQFTAKITSTAPILRFRGKGTVSFMGYPDLVDARQLVTDLQATLGAQDPILPITGVDGTSGAPVANAPLGGNAVISNDTDVANYIARIQSLLTAGVDQSLAASAAINSPSNYENFQETHRMRVYGSRRFL